MQALAAAHRTLRGVNETALAGIEALGGLAGEVVRLHTVVLASLQEQWYDVDTLLEAATTLCQTADLGAVILYLPQDFSRAQAAFATGLAEPEQTSRWSARSPVSAGPMPPSRAGCSWLVWTFRMALPRVRRPGCSTHPTPTTKSGGGAGGRARSPRSRPTGWPSSTRRLRRTRGCCTSTSRPPASRSTEPARGR